MDILNPEPWLAGFFAAFTAERIGMIIRITLLIVIGIPILQLISRSAERIAKKYTSAQYQMLIQKGIFYAGIVFIGIMIMNDLGFKLGAILGAAGIAGVAIGFASQTSLSNLISGIFLISEKPFEVGNILKVGDTVGIVLNIDLMSVQLRTFNNQFIRIPNETLIKTQFTNINRFPIRRIDINISVAYKEDIARVMDVLKDVYQKNPYALDEPEPLILFDRFGESSQELLFGVWCERDDFIVLKNSIMIDIKERFNREKIEFAFPHRALYSGSFSQPFPIRLIHADGESNAAEASPSPS